MFTKYETTVAAADFEFSFNSVLISCGRCVDLEVKLNAFLSEKACKIFPLFRIRISFLELIDDLSTSACINYQLKKDSSDLLLWSIRVFTFISRNKILYFLIEDLKELLPFQMRVLCKMSSLVIAMSGQVQC